MTTDYDGQMMSDEATDQRIVFSNPELKEIREALTNAFGATIEQDESFEVAAALSGDHIEMVIVLGNYDRTKVCRLQAATEVDDSDPEDFLNARADVVEFLSAMLEEYLESSRLNALHVDWKEYEYAGRVVFFRSSLEDEKARELADEWLNRHDPDLS